MIDLVIFDLDGLLADTEKLHMKAYQNTLSSIGYNGLSDNEYSSHWIRHGKGIVDYVKEHKLNLDIEEIRIGKAKEYSRLVKLEVEPMPGAKELLKDLHNQKIKTALATASYSHSAKVVLETLGFKKYFQFIASKESIKRNKPFPDIFLLVAKKMNVLPEKCLVLEDAEKGILAAHAAGMKSIAVPNRYTKKNDFTKADFIFKSLKEIDTLKIINLFK